MGFDPVSDAFSLFAYGVQGITNQAWLAGTRSLGLTFVPDAAAVPEPGSLALAGLALLGASVCAG